MNQVVLPLQKSETFTTRLSCLLHSTRWNIPWRPNRGSWHQSRLQHGHTNLSSSQDVEAAEAHRDIKNNFGSIDSAEPEGHGDLKELIEKKLRGFDLRFLRDACSCPHCVDPSTKQKRFQTADIPSAINLRSISYPKAGAVRIVWRDDILGWGKSHTSDFPAEFFQACSTYDTRMEARYEVRPQVLWNREVMEEKIKWFNYEAYLHNDEKLLEFLEHLSAFGLIFLRGVPGSEQAVDHIAARIGNLRDTFYGRTWDVKSVPDAKNVAYTHQSLGLHMDLLYMAQPPGLQLLHCLHSSCTGGASVFSDSFRAALSLKKPHLNSLSSFPVTYHYHNAGHHYHYRRPTIEWRESGSRGERHIANVNWSPPFQAPFEATQVASKDFRTKFSAYLGAAKAFSDAVEAPKSIFELRLEPGQCVIFDNRRVLHARRAFDVSSGERWLKGAYIDQDTFLSRLRVMRESSQSKSQPTGVE